MEPDLIALATAHVIGIRSFGALIGVAIASAISAPSKCAGEAVLVYTTEILLFK